MLLGCPSWAHSLSCGSHILVLQAASGQSPSQGVRLRLGEPPQPSDGSALHSSVQTKWHPGGPPGRCALAHRFSRHLHSSLHSAGGPCWLSRHPSLLLSRPTVCRTGKHHHLRLSSHGALGPATRRHRLTAAWCGADATSALLLGEQGPGGAPDRSACSSTCPFSEPCPLRCLSWRWSSLVHVSGHCLFRAFYSLNGSMLALPWGPLSGCSLPHCEQDTHLGEISLIQVCLPSSLMSPMGT